MLTVVIKDLGDVTMRQITYLKICVVMIVLLEFSAGTASGSGIKDTESATHGADASQYQIVDIYEYPGFKLIQINLPVLSHYSYIVASDGQALLVDPVVHSLRAAEQTLDTILRLQTPYLDYIA